MSSATANAPMEPRAYHLPEEPHLHEGHSTMLGFWMYLMSDCLIFAILFATYAVLGGSYAGGPGPKDLFDLNLIALNTAMLLFSSITYGFAMLAMEKDKVGATQAWLAITGLFGLAFLSIELYEFAHLIHEGATPQRSGFLSAFFALVGTHGLHVGVVAGACRGNDIRPHMLGVLHGERTHTARAPLDQNFFASLKFAGVERNDGRETG